MKARYDLRVTKYRCRRCQTPIDIESDSFYTFGGVYDDAFWCPGCEDLPAAETLGTPAEELPTELQLAKDFRLKAVPPAEPSDVENWNLLYRPYSKRSFLQQYSSWLMLGGVEDICKPGSNATVNAKFDRKRQEYTNELEHETTDICEGIECQFLGSKTVRPDEVRCALLRGLCDVKNKFGLCETGDEAMILQQYLLLTGAEHFPMLVPQASILKGKRRPDFVCFVPISRYQYQKVVVLVDRPGKDERKMESENAEYEKEGFCVRRILIDPADCTNSYFKRARELVLWLQEM